ncbi:hypothetical protein QLH52_19180 [Methylomonas sp. OY6]|uniref:Secreted protein n=1 Tax=Methylomonas defluvii TaxID=3045149 RepID=A0ABU4UKR0_9GAMM|nr:MULTISPECIES: hypothetical protein [unclassified Methylomonas]MDX8129432.1 hypothetical protein [Methylomonas sp. OY6]PKD41087.1 hypothetical protein CWO84_06625 [Methylomonas sp. Kb3]
MKLSKKLLAVAVLAAAASGAAEARIQAIGDATADGSEFLFNLVNYTAQNSYTLDLGITVEQFLANPSQPLSFTLSDNNFQSFAAAYTAGNNVAWGVSGGHGVLNELTDLAKFGFYTTSVVPSPSSIDANAPDISNTMGKWNDLVSYIQTQDANSNNLSTFKTVGQQGYTAVYGNDFQTALPFTAQGQLGTALSFVRERANADDFDTGELVTFPGVWNFAINGNVGSLTYTAAPAAVPLPAAVWMFGAGLMGVLRATRRKSLAV